MGRLLTLRRNLARLLTRDEVDDNFVNVASDFSGSVDPATLVGAYVQPYMRWADTGTGWLKRRNAANDGWVEETRLLRRTVQPFDASETPTSDIGPIWLNGQGMAEWEVSKGSYSVRSELPVGKVDWCPLRAAIWAGWIPGDGQTLPRATYPDITEAVLAGRVPVVSEAEWWADSLKRGCYTLGDGSTTIRVPDYNGKSAGSVGAVFLRGDGLLSAGTNGAIQRDALQNITGRFTGRFGAIYTGGTDGAIQVVTVPTSQDAPLSIGTGTQPQFNISFDASRVARTATETRPLAVSGCFVIKAFGVVVNPGSVDAAQLASDYAVLNAAIQSLQGDVQSVKATAFGINQTFQNLTGSRSVGSVYTNSTGRPIHVYFAGTAIGGLANVAIVVDGINADACYTPPDGSLNGSVVASNAVVPPGSTYKCMAYNISGPAWREYR